MLFRSSKVYTKPVEVDDKKEEAAPAEIFKVVEQMPRFPGCEEMAGTDKDKEKCSQGKLMEYIYTQIKYPAMARELGVEGKVFISFVIDINGDVTDLKLIKDIGGECGDEAMRVVKSMAKLPTKWTPGRQRGKAVKVLYNLPVQFKLR